MALRSNDTIPDLKVTTDQGEFTLHDWIGDRWAMLFSHTKVYTPVSTTEFGAVARVADEQAEERMHLLAAHAHLGVHRERDAEVELAKLLYLCLGPGLLPAEVVGRKSAYHQPPLVVALVQFLQSFIVRSEPTLGGDVDQQQHLARMRRQRCRFAGDVLQFNLINVRRIGHG